MKRRLFNMKRLRHLAAFPVPTIRNRNGRAQMPAVWQRSSYTKKKEERNNYYKHTTTVKKLVSDESLIARTIQFKRRPRKYLYISSADEYDFNSFGVYGMWLETRCRLTINSELLGWFSPLPIDTAIKTQLLAKHANSSFLVLMSFSLRLENVIRTMKEHEIVRISLFFVLQQMKVVR